MAVWFAISGEATITGAKVTAITPIEFIPASIPSDLRNLASDRSVKLQNNTRFYDVVYAPASLVEMSGDGEFFGSFVGKKVKVSNKTRVHYDTALRGP